MLLTVETGLSVAVATVRKARTQLAVVTDGENEIGIITFEDVLPSLMPSAILTPAG